MSVIENLRGRTDAKPAPLVQAAEITAKVNAAQAELATLEAQIGPAALEALSAGTEATRSLSDIQGRAEAARDRLATLRAAHKAAIERDAAVIAAQRAALQKTQIAAVRKHLDARDAAAAALATALAEAVTQWKVMVARSEKAQAANPIGGKWPDQDGLCALDGLKRLVSHEIYRLDGGDALTGPLRAFPGALVDDLNNQGRPDRIKPLTASLTANSVAIIAALTGKPVT